ncbi:hypothetical protein Q9L58_003898 [Maublancomyces gigas]|uniref:CYTH domain-containing protein n=1 Tax=Discina gigas TaxID=1032678 RepID=A0ABR3GMP9_9PEZI
MPLHLVSRRFLFSPLLLRPLGLNTGAPRFTAYNYRSTSNIIDIYYDTSAYQLASKDISLRTRNGIWQLKQRVPFYLEPQKVDHLHEEKNNLSTRVWKELTGRREIMAFMEGFLGKKSMPMEWDDSRKEDIVGRTLSSNFGMETVSELEMTRISYVLDNKWVVHLDHVKGSGYQVGKVEAELGAGYGPEVAGVARQKAAQIEEMMDKYRWFFRSVPDPADGVKGKICAWLKGPVMAAEEEK